MLFGSTVEPLPRFALGQDPYHRSFSLGIAALVEVAGLEPAKMTELQRLPTGHWSTPQRLVHLVATNGLL